jgi:hypothetical protein
MNKKNSPIEYHYAPLFLSNSMRGSLGVYKGVKGGGGKENLRIVPQL